MSHPQPAYTSGDDLVSAFLAVPVPMMPSSGIDVADFLKSSLAGNCPSVVKVANARNYPFIGNDHSSTGTDPQDGP